MRSLHGDDDVAAAPATDPSAMDGGSMVQGKAMASHSGGDTFGHVVPGTFFLVMALGLMFWTRQNRHLGDVATNGGSSFLKVFGWTVMIIATTGFLIEGLGGLIHAGNFWHQLAHETMYGVFNLVGAAALLESVSRLPFDSWRVAMVVAFTVEGISFYGHHLEQELVEGTLHYIMFCMSLFTAACFLWASREPASLLPHLLAVAGMCCKGLWFYVVAHVLYSGLYGENGHDFMVATSFTYAGMVLALVLGVFGCVFVGKTSSADSPSAWGGAGTKYTTVAANEPGGIDA
jgi:hypothetical protein